MTEQDKRIICVVAAASAPTDTLPALFDRHRQFASWLSPGRALDMGPIEPQAALKLEIDVRATIQDLPIDCFHIPAQSRRKQLLASDMDSTMITIECIDELAALVGRKAKIATITERAMAGELDFAASLIERVRCLAGVRLAEVEAVCRDQVHFSPGARELVATMNSAGARTILVSGGFRLFTRHVAQVLGFHADFANDLIIAEGKLTGEVTQPVFAAADKMHVLNQQAANLGLDRSQTLAVGDGANDAPMIEAAGLGVAYYGKPSLRELSDISIIHTDLRSLLYAQGFHDREIHV